MHASLFHLDMDDAGTADERWRACLSLAAALEGVDGFIAFLALEAADGTLAGLCICVDEPSLDDARQVATAWQRERGSRRTTATQPTMTGEVIVQRGF